VDDTRIALLVDDELASRAAHQTRLESQGFTVFVAMNQADALSRAKLSAPKVIYAHLSASGAGNLPLIHALRSDDTCRHIPVVVIADGRSVGPRRTNLHAVPHDSW